MSTAIPYWLECWHDDGEKLRRVDLPFGDRNNAIAAFVGWWRVRPDGLYALALCRATHASPRHAILTRVTSAKSMLGVLSKLRVCYGMIERAGDELPQGYLREGAPSEQG